MAKPEIRLKGFEEEWSLNLMSEVIKDMYNGQTPYREDSRYWNGDVNWISSGDLNRGIVNCCTEKITKEGQESAHLRLIPKGTFVMAITGLEAAGTRGNCGILGIDTTMNQSCMALFPEESKLSTDFLFQWYRAHSEDLGIRLTQGTKQQSYNASIIKGIELYLPSIKEQKSVTQILAKMDFNILATTKKIASLNQMKQACLVSMFPQTGETTPRVRFKGFEGDWDKKLLSDCLEISNEKNFDNKYGKEDVLSVSDDYGVMNQIELLGRSYAGKSVSNYGVLNQGELVYTKSPLKLKPFGIVKENTGETGIVSVLYAIYRAKEGTSIPYIHYYFDPAWRLNAYLRPLINKGAKNTMNISDETALTGYIMAPKDIKEQQRIASYFRSLDKQISLQEHKLEKLKQIKSACLAKMFV
jgi:type I restriction enzyme S subunit